MPTEKTSIDLTDDTRKYEHGHVEVAHLADAWLARATLEPGWRWSRDVKPMAGTESCEERHHGFLLSGCLQIRMDDGEEMEVKGGEMFVCPPGHDAWVMGDEACVLLEFAGTPAVV